MQTEVLKIDHIPASDRRGFTFKATLPDDITVLLGAQDLQRYRRFQRAVLEQSAEMFVDPVQEDSAVAAADRQALWIDRIDDLLTASQAKG